jgi:hypothetical protein
MFIKRGDGKVLSVIDPEELEDVEGQDIKKVAVEKLKKKDPLANKSSVSQDKKLIN